MPEKKTKQDIGQELYFLKPVSHIRDISEQIKEIDRRLKILWDKRQSHDPPLPIAPAHLQASLGLVDDVWKDWLNADAKVKIPVDSTEIRESDLKAQGKSIKDRGSSIKSVRLAAEDTLQSIEKIELIKQRSTTLTQWLKRCEATYLDTAANPTYKGGQQGSIKGLEMCYGYKTTEQLEVVSKGDDLAIGLEAYRKRQAAKGKKTS
jgi:hypothetical protein